MRTLPLVFACALLCLAGCSADELDVTAENQKPTENNTTVADMCCAPSDFERPDMTPPADMPKGQDAAVEGDGATGLDLARQDMAPDPCEAFDLPKAYEVIEGALVKLTLPAGEIAGASIEGGRAWKDDEGAWWVRMPYGQESATLILEAGCGDEKQRDEVSVKLKKIQWEKPFAWVKGPSAREFTHTWIDPKDRDTLYLYGGYVTTPQRLTVAKDLWRLDLVQDVWTQVSAQEEQAPTAAAMAVTVDEASGLVVISGGSDARKEVTNLNAYTFSADAAQRWTPLVGEQGTNELGGTVYDAPRGRFVDVLGNDETSEELSKSNTWSWTLKNPEPVLVDTAGAKPTPRYSFPYVLDPKAQRVVVFGGAQAPIFGVDFINAARDTWFLDLATTQWSQFQDQGVSPAPRRGACTVYDALNHRMVVWGGSNGQTPILSEVAILDLDQGQERWHILDLGTKSVPRASCSGIYDQKRGRALFGFGYNGIQVIADMRSLRLE